MISPRFAAFFGAVLALPIISGHAQVQHKPIEDSRDVAGASVVRNSDKGGQTAGPICTIQHPDLLNRYRIRPRWTVAGVDYCVGCPANAPLKDPATISMAGVSLDTNRKTITITGDDVTLDGYDFGAWSVVTTAANTSLINSNFNGLNPGGPQTSVISGSQTSSNLLVSNCTIDGLSGGGHAEFLVEMEGPGLTVQYSWLKNSNSDLIGRHGRNGGDITIRNNLMEQAGMGGPGTHGDYLQVYGPNINATHILYNTTVQNGGITQGFFADNTNSAEIGGNTFTGDFNYFISGSGPNTDPAALTGEFNVHDNYFDPSHVNGLSYPVYGPNDRYTKSLFTQNVNMVTGRIVQDTDRPKTTPSRSHP